MVDRCQVANHAANWAHYSSYHVYPHLALGNRDDFSIIYKTFGFLRLKVGTNVRILLLLDLGSVSLRDSVKEMMFDLAMQCCVNVSE